MHFNDYVHTVPSDKKIHYVLAKFPHTETARTAIGAKARYLLYDVLHHVQVKNIYVLVHEHTCREL